MNAAWEQIGKVLEAQRKSGCAQFGLAVSQVWYDRHIAPMLGVSQQQTLLLMAPLNKRIVNNGFTCISGLSRKPGAAGDDVGRLAAHGEAAWTAHPVAAVHGRAPRRTAAGAGERGRSQRRAAESHPSRHPYRGQGRRPGRARTFRPSFATC